MRDQLRWLERNRGSLQVEFRKITDEWKMYSVQGPDAMALVNAVVDTPVDGQKFFRMADNTMDGIPVKVHRAGYTGEKYGYEIYISAAQEDALVAKLEKEGNARLPRNGNGRHGHDAGSRSGLCSDDGYL